MERDRRKLSGWTGYRRQSSTDHGLVHISEVAHKRVGNINDELEIGQIVKAKILEIDKDRKRISLSIRETIEPPAEDEAQEAEATEE